MNYKDIVYEHLGHSKFDNEKFIPVSNVEDWIKPKGGLWASPENTAYNWRDWVQVNEFMLDKYSTSFRFKLKDTTRLLVIDSANQLTPELLREGDSKFSKIMNVKLLDYNKIAGDYDAMLVLISADGRLYWDLYGWDCDSLLIFNPSVIVEL